LVTLKCQLRKKFISQNWESLKKFIWSHLFAKICKYFTKITTIVPFKPAEEEKWIHQNIKSTFSGNYENCRLQNWNSWIWTLEFKYLLKKDTILIHVKKSPSTKICLIYLPKICFSEKNRKASVDLEPDPLITAFYPILMKRGRLTYWDPIFSPILLNLREIEVEVDLQESWAVEELTEENLFWRNKSLSNIWAGWHSSTEG